MRAVTAVAGFFVLAAAIAPTDVARNCIHTGSEMGVCGGISGNGQSLNVEATESIPSSPSQTPGPSGAENDPSGNHPGGSVPAPDGSGLGMNPRLIRDALDLCADDACDPPPRPRSTVTLSDLASFTPAAPSIRMEPTGWVARGLPANFIADTGVNTSAGSLLGRPAEVRFTPVAYTWDWGDGMTDTFGTPGRSWEDLGLGRFAETETSHVFADRDTVTVRLNVAFTAEYRFDEGSWIAVSGTVAATASSDVHVVAAKTVLVDEDCTDDPTGPGC